MSDWMIRRRLKKQADYERKFEESRKQQLLKHSSPSVRVRFKPVDDDDNVKAKATGRQLKLNDESSTTEENQTKVSESATIGNSIYVLLLFNV